VPVEDDPVAVSALVAAATDGDEAAWNNLIERYGPLVMAVLARFRLYRADAEDVSQVVWLRLVEHLGELREPRALPRWLITTTRNECIRLLRARRQVEPFDPLQENAPGEIDRHEPDENLLRAERRQALLEAFAEMSDPHRALLLLLLHDPPLSYATISERLEIPIGSIGPTRARLLTKLRSSPALAALFESARETARHGGDQHDVQALAGR
jgi:RNA polymerase sigma factor (sigma-70 family)